MARKDTPSIDEANTQLELALKAVHKVKGLFLDGKIQAETGYDQPWLFEQLSTAETLLYSVDCNLTPPREVS